MEASGDLFQLLSCGNATDFEEDNLSNISIRSTGAKEKWAQAYFFRALDPGNYEEWVEGLLLRKGEPNIFKDPFQNLWQKVGALVSYIVQLLDSIVILAFVAYERQGLAGPFRTVINQLVSHYYLMEVIYVIGPSAIDITRILTGPLPPIICEVSSIAKNCICINILLVVVCITFIKFMFICVWKNMRQLDDNFLVRFIIRSTLMVSVLVSLSKSMVHPRELIMNNVVCIGHFNPLKQIGDAPFPIYEALAGIAFLIYFGLFVAIRVQKRKIKKEDQNQGVNANVAPKSLENLALKFSIMLTLFISACTLAIMNRMNPFELNEGLNWIYPYFNNCIGTVMILSFTAIKIVVQNGKDIQRELFAASFQPIDPPETRMSNQPNERI